MCLHKENDVNWVQFYAISILYNQAKGLRRLENDSNRLEIVLNSVACEGMEFVAPPQNRLMPDVII